MASFTPKDPAWINKMKKAYENADKAIDTKLSTSMTSAVRIVYTTASARRPKISMSQHKAMGGKSKVNGKSAYRVSDPDAVLGVPVKSGNLQSSIKKDILKNGEKFTGKIYIDGPGGKYAEAIEYGTSRMRARPFMRPAINLNSDKIKKIFRGQQKE